MSAMTISAVPVPRQARPMPARPMQVQEARSGSLQLTRRGRFVALLFLLGLVLAASVLFSAGSVATGDAGPVPATRSVVVSEGDTLWGIASEVAEPGAVRSVINDIERLNQLTSSMLVEGQTLVVPAP